METYATNHRFFVFTLITILIVLSVQRNSYGQNLNVGEPRTEIKLWDVATRRNIATLSQDVVLSVSFSPDGTILASGDEDGTVKLWDVGSITTQETESTNGTVPLLDA